MAVSKLASFERSRKKRRGVSIQVTWSLPSIKLPVLLLITTFCLANQLTYAQESRFAAENQTEQQQQQQSAQTTVRPSENQSSTTSAGETTTHYTSASAANTTDVTEQLSLSSTSSSGQTALRVENENTEKQNVTLPVIAPSNLTEQRQAEIDEAQRAHRLQEAAAPVSPGGAPTTKSAPILRPSLEEVASELSRKYLNLERHKQTTSAAATAQESRREPSEAEQDIQLRATDDGSSSSAPSSPSSSYFVSSSSSLSPLRSTRQPDAARGKSGPRSQQADGLAAAVNEAHYLNVDSAAYAAAAAAAATRPPSNRSRASLAARRKKLLNSHLVAYLQGAPSNEDTELYQCQQYLQRHSTAYQALIQSSAQDLTGAPLAGKPFSYSASQLLPCSCQQTSWHFASSGPTNLPVSLEAKLNIDRSRVWLNCDNIQLIGSQLFTPYAPANAKSNSSSSADISDGGGGSRFDDDDRNDNIELAITKLSQRDAGLQVLFSQKFHYLQLSALRSVDLSQNRLRQIRMDAFHGLENSLEFLNLAHNLLGDARAMFDGEQQKQQQQQQRTSAAGAQHTGATRRHQTANNNNGKLIFHCDELNRLRKLKWLSLQGNQINQIGSNVFVQQHQHQAASAPSEALHRTASQQQDAVAAAATSTELLYLDLSDNLLKSVPSDAIVPLVKLEALRLNRNKIIQLDQHSKFPVSLKYLDLSENLISSIRQSDLIDLQHLIELNLSNNQLRHLDQSAFISASALIQSPSSSLVKPSQQAEANTGGGANSHDDPTRKLVDSQRFGPLGSKIAPSDGQPEATIFEASASNERVSSIRRRRQIKQEAENEVENDLLAEESSNDSASEGSLEDLEADESIFSTLAGQFKGASQQPQLIVSNDELNAPRAHVQFNSTLKLNLSNNFFENVPGDSLLKFSHLQTLDLSYNRIQRLDSNYLCSIYNLVDHLRHLDLSGNLLSLDRKTTSGSDNHRHMYKLFGCLQRLEKLFLSTNRLAASDRAQTSSDDEFGAQAPTTSEPDSENARTIPDGLTNTAREDASAVDPGYAQTKGAQDQVRLTIKFGENYGSKLLNTLDLSDNQLRLFPIIQQVIQQPYLVSQGGTLEQSNVSNQAQLNQWMSSRVHLESLNLNYNYLERLDDGHQLEHLFNLQQLHLNFNKLTVLPARIMSRFTSLDRLSLAGNQISSLEPLNELLERSMRTLKTLNLANNRLASWPQMTIALASLASGINSGQHHQLIAPELVLTSSGTIEAAKPLQQTMADSGHQHLSAYDFALEDLNLEGNLLTSLNVTTLFDQLIYMKSLRSLNLNYNLLNKIQSDWFKYANKNLQRLSLAGNKINRIDLGAFALNQVNELTTLNLDFNLLRELKRKTFDSMPKIRELHLAHNLIHTINSETFHYLNSLQVLKLNNNKLTSWKCEYFSSLCNSISGNINVDLATLLLTSSHQQSTKHAQTSTGPSSPAATTTTTGQPIAISSLIELDLSHNSLSQLRANSISVHTKLVKLNLSHNKLSFIPHDVFKATTSIGLSNGRQIHLVSSLKYLNLAHNRIQTIDNINFKPLKNLYKLDLSYNDLQSLGVDVISLAEGAENAGQQDALLPRRVVVGGNLTSLLIDNDAYDSASSSSSQQRPSSPTTGDQPTTRAARSLNPSTSAWPALSKLRYLNLSHNALTVLNQSLLSELSPFVSLNLDLSFNYLDSDSLPAGFFTKVSSPAPPAVAAAPPTRATGTGKQEQQQQQQQESQAAATKSNYDLVFTLKLESLDLSHNRLGEWPSSLLDSHYASLESCSLAYNRIQNLPQNSNSMIQIKRLNFEFNPLSRESSELVLFEQRSSRHLNLAATRLYAIQQATADNTQYSSAFVQTFAKTAQLVNQTSQLDLIRSISKPIEAPYLRHLNLSSNQLVWLSSNVFDKLHSLQTLDLSNNQLTRLHLLSNQLNQVSNSLEYLNLGSNLFTSIDSTDFNSLARLRHLDLSNLLSLQKLNCRFLSKLSTLVRLKMFNYPQLRYRINNLLNNLMAAESQQFMSSERYRLKLQDELVMSTIGGHCFVRQDSSVHSSMKAQLMDGDDGSRAMETVALNNQQEQQQKNWYKLDEIELELFNNFVSLNKRRQRGLSIDSFHLTNELRQILAPQTKKLTLFGLNLTTIGEDSLLGVISQQLDLKISYTSLSHLPLGKILTSLAKRTKLRLDLRNNNIQTIDVDALKWLEELQQNNQANSMDNSNYNSHETDNGNSALDSSSSLRLASNPFRCDCQTRPLWLWLNQRWDNVEPAPQQVGASDEQFGAGDTPTSGNGANYWLKFHTISQTNDLRCFYPLKLRGKLAQHVYYNDLVCKGPSSSSSSSASNQANRQPASSARKRNETYRSSESYYLTSSLGDASDIDELDDSEDYTESIDGYPGGRLESPVRVTKFNRYPSIISNSTSMYFVTNFPAVPFVPDKMDLPLSDDGLDASNRIGKRDQASSSSEQDQARSSSSGESASGQRENNNVGSQQQQPQHPVSTKYNKHRPNTQQRHAHHSTLTNLNSAKFGRANSGRSADGGANTGTGSQSVTKHSLLTKSDIMILTVASIAMTIMAFIIMSICLFKYKLSRNDEEQILRSTQSRLIMSRALFGSKTNLSSSGGGGGRPAPKSSSGGSATSSKQSSSRSKPSSSSKEPRSRSSHQTNKKSPSSSGGQEAAGWSGSGRQHSKGGASTSPKQHKFSHTAITKQQQEHPPHNTHVLSFPLLENPLLQQSQHLAYQKLKAAPMVQPHSVRPFLQPVSQNFLMRSPTIRRMHGLAGSASDWFRYTLRAYPSATGSRRRRLFIQNNALCVGPSQLTTAKMAAAGSGELGIDYAMVAPDKISSLSSLILSGCPFHEFSCLIGGAETNHLHECLYCNNLQLAMQHTKLRYPFTRRPVTSALDHSNWHSLATAAAASSQGQVAGEHPTTENNEVADKVEIAGEAASNERKQQVRAETFQKTIDQSCGFMPPKMIQALARHLDEQQQQQQQIQQQIASNSLMHSRDQPVKSMKTFSAASGKQQAAAMRSAQQAATKQSTASAATSSVDGAPSQIPTIDVDGRFTYQSDSHIDSPYAPASEQTSRGANGREGASTPASTVATNQEDIFVLVRDTPTSETPRGSLYESATSQQHGYDGASGADAESQTTGTERRSSIMHDECSRTSSPVAYGFMRSSPSATTLSSNHTMTSAGQSQHKHQRGSFYNQDHEDQRRPKSLTASEQRQSQLFAASSFKGATSNRHQHLHQPTLDENNNNAGPDKPNAYADQPRYQSSKTAKLTSKWAHNQSRQQQQQRQQCQQSSSSFESCDEQLIVSRL